MNKKNLLFIVSYVLIALGIRYFLSQKYSNIAINIDKQLSGSIQFSGDVFSGMMNGTGDAVLTGSEYTGGIIEEKNDYMKFQEFLERNFVRRFAPPSQPIFNGGNYNKRSDILNSYLKENNFYFRVSQKLDKGYLYIRLNKPLDNDEDIFLYFHDTRLNGYPVSGKLLKSKNLILGSNEEFLYRLEDIRIKKFYDGKIFDYDWLNLELNYTKKLHFIGGYTTTSNGNYIKEFVITGT